MPRKQRSAESNQFENNPDTMLSSLISEREGIKNSLSRFTKYLDDLAGDFNTEELATRLERIQISLDQFEHKQGQIESLQGTRDENEREIVENQYFNAVGKAKTMLNSNIKEQHSSRSSSENLSAARSHNKPFDNVKLPIIKLPEFDGKMDKWLAFCDSFTSLVHENLRLSEVERLIYLKDCLRGEPAKLVQSLENTKSNYAIAWGKLKERYENKKLIVREHIQAILDLQPVKYAASAQLRSLIDNVNQHLKSLTVLNQPTQHWDTLIIQIVSNKLDTSTRSEWENSTQEIDFPTLEQFIKFLEKRSHHLTMLENQNKLADKSKGMKLISHVVTRTTCVFCKQSHFNYQCDKIKSMSAPELSNEIKKHKLCLNCLRPFHTSLQCKAHGCRFCGRKHFSLLHNNRESAPNAPSENSNTQTPRVSTDSNPDRIHTSTPPSRESQLGTATSAASSVQTRSQPSPSSEIENENRARVNLHCTDKKSQTLLATATVYVLSGKGRIIQARALLDSGSQISFMTKSLYHRLNLRSTKISLPVIGVNSSMNHINDKVDAVIKSSDGKYTRSETFFLVDKISENLPQISFELTALNIPKHVHLADPECHTSQSVELLLGANIFFEILCVGQINLGPGLPILQKTKVGWVLSGTLTPTTEKHMKALCNFNQIDGLKNQLEKFWKLEEGENQKYLTPEEAACEEHFQKTHQQDVTGRFVVSLPVRDTVKNLGDSETTAINRFYSLERKLQRDEHLRIEYNRFMNEYEVLGHMTQIDSSSQNESVNKYYLPHHSVFKESSTTTKVRVVFDASAKTDTGTSLNDVLLTGPVIQRDLYSIILKFRLHTVVLTGDIEKMYRQVLITASDRDLQRIVWRSSPEQPLKHYRLNTVTYGTASASFLAVRSLQQCALSVKGTCPETADIILDDFYVDDLLTGAESVEQVRHLKQEITKVLARNGFPLRKFMSNYSELIQDEDKSLENDHSLSEDKLSKTLGLYWAVKTDTFKYCCQVVVMKSLITKRQILSATAMIFDPIGFLQPITIKAKLILQKLWQCKLNWDEGVSIDIQTDWNNFQDDLLNINSVNIPRQVTIPGYDSLELHGFCDSSQVAYGAVIYLVSNHEGNRSSRLLTSKSRVAPLKTISLPRLELCGAVLLAQLAKKVEEALQMTISKKYFWCDSKIALSWIADEPSSWKTFVANRVSHIQGLTQKEQWFHVTSEQNPADLITRGTTVKNLIKCNLWWEGPAFLLNAEECSTKTKHFDIVDVPERKKAIQLNFLNVEFDLTIFDRISTYSKLIRTWAYVLRFIDIIKKQKSFKNKISIPELERARLSLIKIVQSIYFNTEIQDLTKNKQVNAKSKLHALAPFIDENGIVRVGGRIRNSKLTPDVKHPIILPSKHKLSAVIVEIIHEENLHAGNQATLNALRQIYWIIHGKNLVKRIIHQCLTCFKNKPSFSVPMMADLPDSRVIPARPFLRVGCDFAGPLMVKDGKLRNRKLVKTYLCIFVCFVTRAVHIELAGDLSTDCFLNCLKRFVSRRGLCTDIYTDNGTNFVGSNSELKRILACVKSENDNELTCYLTKNQIQWHFTPPRSPHFGGLWEAAVKSAKYHITRVLKQAFLTYEQLYTVVCQVESVLNSRPLTPLSNDPNDLTPLTPSHFLINDLLTCVPQRNVYDVATNRLNHYERLQQIVQHFWRRWSQDYLTSLQTRTKWRETSIPTTEGSMVLLRDENTHPNQWKLGRILQLHPGSDGIVRVVTVKTNTGVFKRSVSNLAVLPYETLSNCK